MKLMKSVNLIFHENACCRRFFMSAIMLASKIWLEMAHQLFCLKFLVGLNCQSQGTNKLHTHFACFFQLMDYTFIKIQGCPKFVTPTSRPMARRFLAHSDTYLINILLLSTIRGCNSLKYSMCSFRATPF